MQDRYVGDIGDYGKYALLRSLCARHGRIRLAVVWCLYPAESITNDGKYISYLNDPRFASLDPDLHSALHSIVSAGRRLVSAVNEYELLPSSTVFFTKPTLVSHDERIGTAARIGYRNAWLRACLQHTEGCDLIFFDPDNGLEVTSIPKYHPRAGKYIYWDELSPFWERGNSLVVYHHLNRTVSAARQVEVLAQRFSVELKNSTVVPLVFRRGSSRVFWLIHQRDGLGRELERRAADMLRGAWSHHFRPFGWPGPFQAAARTL